jgi:polar amino acid transport system substrate-binding protein
MTSFVKFFLNGMAFLLFHLGMSAYGAENAPLIIGMELGYPPFEMIDPSGNPAGISVELAQALGQHLNRKIKIENIPFLGLIPALKTEKIDLILSSMSITPQRKASIDFSDPYLKIGLSLLVSMNSPLQSIVEANNSQYKFVVKAGTSGEVYARQYLAAAKIIVLDKETSCVLEVVQGKVDAFIYDQLSVYQNWKKNPQTTRALLKPFDVEEWGIGVRKGNEALLFQVNEFLRSFKGEDGIKKIVQKFLEPQMRTFQEMGIPFVF